MRWNLMVKLGSLGPICSLILAFRVVPAGSLVVWNTDAWVALSLRKVIALPINAWLVLKGLNFRLL